MYRVIGYHGIGKREVADDLRLLWDNFNNFAKHRRIQHIYCSQVLDDKKGADVLLVIQYEDSVGTLQNTLRTRPPRWMSREDCDAPTTSSHERIDYWFYVREDNHNEKRRRVLP